VESGSTRRGDDLVHKRIGLLVWCVPIAALIVGDLWVTARIWLWIPAFTVMGMACLANAARCGRVHCYLTGPVFLFAAIYTALSALHLVPLRAAVLLDSVLALTVLAFLAEIPIGQYRKMRQ
jgi:hypothetical protein